MSQNFTVLRQEAEQLSHLICIPIKYLSNFSPEKYPFKHKNSGDNNH